jgi:hypothetical protein
LAYYAVRGPGGWGIGCNSINYIDASSSRFSAARRRSGCVAARCARSSLAMPVIAFLLSGLPSGYQKIL